MDLKKLCKKCLEWKSFNDFHNDTNRKDGKYPNCKECHYAYMRNRYKHKPGVREHNLARAKHLQLTSLDYRNAAARRSEKFYSSTIGRAKTLLNAARSRDPNATVTLERLVELLKIGICPVTGIKFNLTARTHQKITGQAKNPFSPSIDQIVPKLGYTPENTRLVIWQYNMMKGELSDAVVLHICKQIIKVSENV